MATSDAAPADLNTNAVPTATEVRTRLFAASLVPAASADTRITTPERRTAPVSGTDRANASVAADSQQADSDVSPSTDQLSRNGEDQAHGNPGDAGQVKPPQETISPVAVTEISSSGDVPADGPGQQAAGTQGLPWNHGREGAIKVQGEGDRLDSRAPAPAARLK